jgi:hypothetical protein
MNDRQPRGRYRFERMEVGDEMHFDITDGRTSADRALKAAYAYGRRNKKQFFGFTETDTDGKLLVIKRHK